jgi:hypothetical protein
MARPDEEFNRADGMIPAILPNHFYFCAAAEVAVRRNFMGPPVIGLPAPFTGGAQAGDEFRPWDTRSPVGAFVLPEGTTRQICS